MRKLLLLLLLCASATFAQTSQNGRIMEGNLTTRPIACANGDVFIANDQNPPQSFICGNGNGWLAFGAGGGGGAGSFSAITLGTNSQAAMVVGTGASLATSGSGTIASTSAPFAGLSSGDNTTAAMTIDTGASLSTLGTGVLNANQISGTTVPVNSAADQAFLTSASAVGLWSSVPSCLDAAGQHLNYNTSTHAFSCGTSGGTAGSAAFNTITNGTNASAAMVVGTGSSLGVSGSGTIAATSSPFSGLTASTNSTAAMVLGTGSSLTVSGSGVNNANQVSGTTVPVNSAADQFLGTTASATGAWAAMPSCLDAGGNHINYNTSTHAFSCGTSGGTAGSAAFNTITPGTNSSAAMVVGTGASLGTSGSGTITATAVPFSGLTTSTNTTATLTVGTGAVVTTSGTGQINANFITGTTVPTNSASDQVLGTTASATGSWLTVPNCLDTLGQHINYNTSIHAFACGTTSSGGGGTSPGGTTQNIQYNTGGLFGGDANLTWDFTNKVLGVTGNLFVKGPVPSVNVMAFGATGTGNTHDDTTAIQAAINYSCTHNRATIEFPPPPQWYSVTQTQTGVSATQPIFYGCSGPGNPALVDMVLKGSNGLVNRPQFSYTGAAIVAVSGASPNPAPVFLLGNNNKIIDLNIEGLNMAVMVGQGGANPSANNAIEDCSLVVLQTGLNTSTLPNSPLVLYSALWFWMTGGSLQHISPTGPTVTILQDGGQTDGLLYFTDIVSVGGGVEAKQILANQSPQAGNWVFRNFTNEVLSTPFLFFDDDGTHHWNLLTNITLDHSGTSDGTPASIISLNSTGMRISGITFNENSVASNTAIPAIQVFAGSVDNVFSTGNNGLTKIVDGSGNLLGNGVSNNGNGWDYFVNTGIDETFVDTNSATLGPASRLFIAGNSQASLGFSKNGFLFNNGTANGFSGQLTQTAQETIDVGFAKYLPPTGVSTTPTTGGSLALGTYHYYVVAADSAAANTFSAYSTVVPVTLSGSNNAVIVNWTPSATSVATPGGYFVVQQESGHYLFISGAGSSTATDTGSGTGCCYGRTNTNSMAVAHRFNATQLGVNTTSPAYTLDVNGQVHGASYFDFTEIAAPANPSSGSERIWADSTTHLLTCKLSSGANCISGGGGGGSFQVNGVGLTSSTTVNFQNSASTTGLTLGFQNPSAGNVQLTLSGALTISGGGTGQTTQTAGFDALSPTTTRGDIIVRNASNNVRLALGTNNQVLTSNGTDAVWATPTTISGSGTSGQVSFWNGATSQTGSANFLYAAASGISLIQGANAADTIYTKRATDTSPTGNFLHFQNAAASVDMFKLDVSGNESLNGSLTTGTGAVTHYLQIPEGTTAGGATGFGTLSADSTSHTMQVSNNNGTFFSIPAWATTTPTAHGVALVHPSIFPLLNWTGAGTAGQCLVSGGASADPSFSSCGVPALTSTHIFVGNGSNVATDVAMSGDGTMSNTGALTLATVNSNTGTSTPASITVNGKGLVTAILKITDIATTVSAATFAANTCSSASGVANTTTTAAMTGVVSTMTFSFTPNADISGVTGWGSTGGLVIDPWPTTDTLNYKVCNQTASAITTSSSVTFNVSAR